MIKVSDKAVIVPIPAFADNYFWCITRTGNPHAVIVDPGASEPVQTFLKNHRLHLSAILVTHHHPDHTGGLSALRRHYPGIPVYGPKSKTIEDISRPLGQGDGVELPVLGLSFTVIEVPGHTLDHIAYYCEDHEPPLLFCGDTLFSAGCGRLFEGTAGQLYHSLGKLISLPPETLMFCGHEYTLNNIRFAKQVEPDNARLLEYEQSVSSQRNENLPSLPSTLALEMDINPFLRVDRPNVKARVEEQVNVDLQSPVEVFAALRQWKDSS